jgi:hypothetical protein
MNVIPNGPTCQSTFAMPLLPTDQPPLSGPGGNVSLRLVLAPAWPAERRSAAGHAADAGTKTSGAGGLYPIEAWGLTVCRQLSMTIWASRKV